MHLAEGGTPTNPNSGADDRIPHFPNSIASSQQPQREQVPIHIPSSQAASAQPPHPPHLAMSGSTNPPGNPSSLLGPSKSIAHDSVSATVRYKVS